MRRKIRWISMLCAMVILIQGNIVNASAPEKINVKSFQDIMNDYNISISGSDKRMTLNEFQGLVKEIQEDTVLEKFNNKTLVRANEINITPEEIVEIEYYSKNDEEREEFLENVKNQEIEVQMDEGIILISYNTNSESVGSSLITSSRTGTIKMQDPVMGNWGSAEVTLTAIFKKTVLGNNQYKLMVTSSKFKEDNTPPVNIVGGTKIYDTFPITFNGPYVGNELKCHSLTQVSCAYNSSSLAIYVYPNSSYNYAKIGE